MTVDIIIPFYYKSEIIRPCLEKIAIQTVINDITLIIVNDCSPNTDCEYQDLINEFSNRIKIRYFKTPCNSGPGVARQLGLDNATSDWIMFIDDDDELADKTSVEKLLNLANLEDVISVTGQSKHIRAGSTESYIQDPWIHHHGSIYNRRILEEKHIRYDSRLSYLDEDCLFSHMIMLYTRNEYKQLKLFEVIYLKKSLQGFVSLTGHNDLQKTILHRIGLNVNIFQYAYNVNDSVKYYCSEATVIISNLLYLLSTFKEITLNQKQKDNLISFVVQFNNLNDLCNFNLTQEDCKSILDFYNDSFYIQPDKFKYTYENVQKYKDEHLNWLSKILNNGE